MYAAAEPHPARGRTQAEPVTQGTKHERLLPTAQDVLERRAGHGPAGHRCRLCLRDAGP